MKKIMAVFIAGCLVSVGSFSFERVHEIRVQSSWKTLGDTAIIKLPLLKGKVAVDKPKTSLASLIKKGDRVVIEMGYKGNKSYDYTEFVGFVRKINTTVPMELECEDALYLCRKVTISFSRKNTSVKEILDYIIVECNKVNTYKIKLANGVPDIQLPSFRIDNVNAAEVLAKIKSDFGLMVYFDDLTLVVGLPYLTAQKTVKYDLTGNVIDNNLTFTTKEDRNIRLKATAILKDNSRIEMDLPNGKTDGEQRSFITTKAKDKATLKLMAENELNRISVGGYEGDLTTFLIPKVQHSMEAEVTNSDFPELPTCKYMVDSVETTFGKGIRRKVSLGVRLV